MQETPRDRPTDWVSEKRLEDLQWIVVKDVAYFATEAPAKEGGRAYTPWVDAVFSR